MIRHSNQDSVASDQGADVLAHFSTTSGLTNGWRSPPLWSWIARHVYTGRGGIFRARQVANTFLCVAFLCGLGIAVGRWLDPLATTNLFAEQPGNPPHEVPFSTGAALLYPHFPGDPWSEDFAERLVALCYLRAHLWSGVSGQALASPCSWLCFAWRSRSKSNLTGSTAMKTGTFDAIWQD